MKNKTREKDIKALIYGKVCGIMKGMEIRDNSIVALSTAHGRGGIAIIRISGNRSLELLGKIFDYDENKIRLSPRKMFFGEIKTDRVMDKGMAVYFAAPNSYTGEDMVEINCHGSPLICEEIIRYLSLNGASIAENGEFSKRAFFNSKLDLIQAESVMDMIEADSLAQVQQSYRALSGKNSVLFEKLQAEVLGQLASIEVALDYPDEAESQAVESVRSGLAELKERLDGLIGNFHNNMLIREGTRIAIIGQANVGKSQLLNALLGIDRAIVTDIKGTTRDTIEESYIYQLRKFVITDTAGIRETNDVIERIGIDRSKKAMEQADIILAVDTEDIPFDIELPREAKVIFVRNKIDLVGNNSNNHSDIAYHSSSGNACGTAALSECGGNRTSRIGISAKFNMNIDELKQKIFDAHDQAAASPLSSVRQFNCAVEALSFVENALKNLGEFPLDCIAMDIRSAWLSLGKITGATATDDIVGEIFSKFCVGK